MQGWVNSFQCVSQEKNKLKTVILFGFGETRPRLDHLALGYSLHNLPQYISKGLNGLDAAAGGLSAGAGRHRASTM